MPVVQECLEEVHTGLTILCSLSSLRVFIQLAGFHVIQYDKNSKLVETKIGISSDLRSGVQKERSLGVNQIMKISESKEHQRETLVH